MGKTGYFVDRLARGLARIAAAAQHPKPVIVRMSDFKTNEYAILVGGAAFEPKEENASTAGVIREARRAGAKIALCGQTPSDHPEFAEFLVSRGIDSISVSPDSFIAVERKVAAAEGK